MFDSNEIRIKVSLQPDDSYKFEMSLTGLLWAPDFPISSFVVPVREEESFIYYLTQDFGNLNGRYGSEFLGEERKIIEQSKNWGIELYANSMSKSLQRGSLVVHDLEPYVSFMFKDLICPDFPLTRPHHEASEISHMLFEVYQKIFCDKIRLDL